MTFTPLVWWIKEFLSTLNWSALNCDLLKAKNVYHCCDVLDAMAGKPAKHDAKYLIGRRGQPTEMAGRGPKKRQRLS